MAKSGCPFRLSAPSQQERRRTGGEIRRAKRSELAEFPRLSRGNTRDRSRHCGRFARGGNHLCRRPSPKPEHRFSPPEAARKGRGSDFARHRAPIFLRPCLGNKLAWFTVGHLEKAEVVIAVESPIDALSYRTIHVCRGDAWAVVSCAGATVPNELMRLAYDCGHSFVVALDNDPAGQRGWRKAWDEISGLERIQDFIRLPEAKRLERRPDVTPACAKESQALPLQWLSVFAI